MHEQCDERGSKRRHLCYGTAAGIAGADILRYGIGAQGGPGAYLH